MGGAGRSRVIVVGVALAVFTACSKTPTPSGSNATVLSFTLTDGGCDPASATAPAGPVTFEVTGASDLVTELEVLNGTNILGEVESVAKGLTQSFPLRLAAGSYTLSCPGGTQTTPGTLTVTGGATGGATQADEQAAVDRYLAYVDTQAGVLVERTGRFVHAVLDGDVGRAKALFAEARAPYEQIEPIAESFGDLDPEIDAREGDVPDNEWTGFHRIEKALWVDGTTDGRAPVARKLLADVRRLHDLIPTLDIDVVQIANGATELLNEVSTSKITGEEDRYSHTDLSDFEANLDGAEAAFRCVAPLLDDVSLRERITSAFADSRRALGRHAEGTGFVSYTSLSNDDTRALSESIDALAEPLSSVASTIAVG